MTMNKELVNNNNNLDFSGDLINKIPDDYSIRDKFQTETRELYDKFVFIDKIHETLDTIVVFGIATDEYELFLNMLKEIYPAVYIVAVAGPKYIDHVIEGIDYIDNSADNLYDQLKEIVDNSNKSLLIIDEHHHSIFETKRTDILDSLYEIGFSYIYIRDINIKVPTVGKYVPLIPEFLIKLDKRIKENETVAPLYRIYIQGYNNGEPLNPLSIDGQSKFIDFIIRCKESNNNAELLMTDDYLAKSDDYLKEGVFLSPTKVYPYHMTDSKCYVLPSLEYSCKKEFGISLRGLGITTHSYCVFKRNSNKYSKRR